MSKDHFIPVSHQKNFSVPLPLKKNGKEIRYAKALTKKGSNLHTHWTTTRKFGFESNLNSGIVMPQSGIPWETFLAKNFDTLSSELNNFWKMAEILSPLEPESKKAQIEFDSLTMGKIAMYVYVLIIRNPTYFSLLSKEDLNTLLVLIETYVNKGKIFPPPQHGSGLMKVSDGGGVLSKHTLPLVRIKDELVAYVPFSPEAVIVMAIDQKTDVRSLSIEEHENNYRSILNGTNGFGLHRSGHHEDTYLVHPGASMEVIREIVYPDNFIRKRLPTETYDAPPLAWRASIPKEYLQ